MYAVFCFFYLIFVKGRTLQNEFPGPGNKVVLYCIVLYCIVLYCIVLYCIVLYCIVLYCIVLYCIKPSKDTLLIICDSV